MSLERTEIKQRIRETIEDGISSEYLKLVSELKKLHNIDDIAAAAIELYSEQGSKREVRRRTLKPTEFVPLKTKELLVRSGKKAKEVERPSGQHQVIKKKLKDRLVKPPVKTLKQHSASGIKTFHISIKSKNDQKRK